MKTKHAIIGAAFLVGGCGDSPKDETIQPPNENMEENLPPDMNKTFPERATLTPGEEAACPMCGGRGQLMYGGGMAASFMACPHCKGKGRVTLAAGDCARCCGTGMLLRKHDWGTVTHLEEVPCPDCNGTGKQKRD